MTRSSNTFIRWLRANINRHLSPSSIPGEGHQYWRERIFHYFSLAFTFIGVAVYIYFALYFLLKGQILHMGFTTFVFISSLIVVSIPRIPISFKSNWVLFMLFLTGTFLLLIGPHSNIGLNFYFATLILAITISGAITGVWYLILSAVSIVLVGFYWYSGFIPHKNLPDISLYSYINYSASYLVLSIVAMAPLISLINGMMFNIQKEQRYRRLLHKEQEDLVMARLKAEESDNLKSAFLSNMSHEIRTPMNAIMGFSNLLSHKSVTEDEKKEFVDLIRFNANNLMSMVEDIIDISKMESGQFEINNSPCQLQQILQEVYATYEEELYRRGVTSVKLYLKKGLADEKVQILTDAARLKKVLNNLVGNAVKFTEKGYVEFGYSVNNYHQLQFYVKDTGIGLPSGTENLIFDRFYKCSNNDEKLYGGTGIGLTIARHLVRYMGGDIWVEPQSSAGTTFYFTIPFQRISAQIPQKMKPWPSSTINWEGKTFLIAEDEEDNFRYLEVALSLFNASLIWARDGREAIEIMSKIKHIDLVLMDIKMPLVDGYTATREIKKINSAVPIIAQTAYAMLGEREMALAAGCNEYIAKPINYNDLIELIQRFIPGGKEHSPSENNPPELGSSF
jgi:signal transduction histidine kinase/ActR/RegA family two-component response regulator